jgi:hypothetical protein
MIHALWESITIMFLGLVALLALLVWIGIFYVIYVEIVGFIREVFSKESKDEA